MSRQKSKAEEKGRNNPVPAPADPVDPKNMPEQPAAPQSLVMSPWERQEKNDAITARRREHEENIDIINKYFQASKDKNILSATITGVGVDGNEVFWLCHEGPITVRIPFKETFDVLPEELLDDNVTNVTLRRRQILSKSIGLTIRFFIEKFMPDPDDKNRGIVLASRIKALARDRQRYFGPNAYKPIREGDKVEAQFLSVGQHIAWISFRGIDVRVKAGDLSHRYLPDLPEVFSTGEKIDVVVTKLTYKEGSDMPEIRVSARPLELEASKKNLSRVPVGSVFSAVVTSRTLKMEDSRTVTRTNLWIDCVEVPAYSTVQALNNSRKYVTGDRVYVEILGYTKYGYVHCKILRHAGQAI